nr:hypothetical protein StreXyl84_32040 [Streptomyces sp. Xyl84]
MPFRINPCLFTYQPRTGPARLPRSRGGSAARCGTLVRGRLYDPGQKSVVRAAEEHSEKHSEGTTQRYEPRKRRRRPVDGADRGNQPIYRRVDTISKQYQASRTHQHDGKTRDNGNTGKTRNDGHDGGGAPWES